MPPPLISRRINNVRIRRINRHIRHARVLADSQHRLPVLPTVASLVKPAIPARPPQRPLRRHINNFRIPRINHHPPNVLGLLQPQILPILPAVIRPINSVPIRHTPLAVTLTRPHPNHCRIIRIKRHPSDRIRSFLIEQRSPRRAIVHRLPHSARSHAHVILNFVSRIHRNRHHSPGSHRRPNRAKLQPGKSVGVHPALLLLFVFILVLDVVFLLVFFLILLLSFLNRMPPRLVRIFILRSRDHSGEGKANGGKNDSKPRFHEGLQYKDFQNRYVYRNPAKERSGPPDLGFSSRPSRTLSALWG